MTSIFQFVPSYTARSAIGIHTREVTRVLQGMGIATHTYVVEARGVPQGEVSPYRSFKPPRNGGPTWLLYQLSTGSPIGDFLIGRAEPLVVNYHNITPAALIDPWEPLVAPELRHGRQQLLGLAARCSLGIADSAFNEGEMIADGYHPTTVVPVLVDFEELAAKEDRALSARLAADKRLGGADWLFVGRIAPNKRQDRLIRALAVYRRLYDPAARLRLVGTSSSDAYLRALQAYSMRLGLSDAVTFAGSVSQAMLTSYYRNADAFVCLSEHEGFCIPVLEAMWHRLVVVALGAAALPETVAGAGLVLPMKDGRQPDASLVAAAVQRVIADSGVRRAMVDAGIRRVQCFRLEATTSSFRRAIAALVEAA